MAEVFGVVASGIGIAGVTVQALDAVQKLQSFCNDVRNAPAEIKNFAKELTVLLSTIASIEAQIKRNSAMCLSMDSMPALHFVDQSARSFNTVIEELDTEIAQKPTLGSMRMAWKKKILESHLMKIERSKNSLHSALSVYLMEWSRQSAIRTDNTIEQLKIDMTILTAPCQALQKTLPGPPQFSDSQRTRRNEQLLVDEGTDKTWQSIRKKSKPPKRTSVISLTLVLPPWLARHSLRVDVYRTAQACTLSLRPYRTISYDANIWQVIQEGDFDRMRNLIESGQATVFDRDNYGWTLLHHVGCCAPSYDRETFLRFTRFLIDRGADVDEPTCDGRLPIDIFCCLKFQDPLESSTGLQNDDVFRILGDEFRLDPNFVWKVFQGTFALANKPPLEGDSKCNASSDKLDFPTITMANRLRDLEGWLNPGFSPQHVANYLGIESFEAAYPTLNEKSKRGLLHGVLHMWGCYSAKADIISEEWENTLQRLFSQGASFELLCDGSRQKERPIRGEKGARGDEVVIEAIRHFVAPYAYVRAWLKDRSPSIKYNIQRFVEGFGYFISKTKHLGMRLEGKSSCKRFEMWIDDDFVEWTGAAHPDIRESEAHTVNLYYDDDLPAWVMWNSMYETYCGDFWDLIDHTERTMPGTCIT